MKRSAKGAPAANQRQRLRWGEEGQSSGAEPSPEAAAEWSGFRPDEGRVGL